jgi:hypothetical protein
MTFTAENSEFRNNDLHIANEAAARLLADRVDEDTTPEARTQIEKSVADAINNAWTEGCTSNELVALVRGGHV